MRIDVPSRFANSITDACLRSGINEVGGILFGEHLDSGYFRVADLTVDEQGLVASFKRSIQHVLGACKRFFKKTNHDYTRFNYLGEWHSHPQYDLYPSLRDDQSMLDIVSDPAVGANFVVLIIVRLVGGKLEIKGWCYFVDQSRIEVDLRIVD